MLRVVNSIDFALRSIPISIQTYYILSDWLWRTRNYDIENYDDYLDPFKIEWVDPNSITKFTGRQYPHWENKEKMIGKVQGGDWDTMKIEDVPDRFVDISVAENFDETVLHKSMLAHFKNNVGWRETKLFQHLSERIKQGETRWRSDSISELLERCTEVDKLYHNIKAHGYLTQLELMKNSNNKISPPKVYTEEIAVDVSRTGELLFVDGRHRLSIAKILDIQIPVIFLVRHKDWMAQRKELTQNCDPVPSHPDLRDIQRKSNK